MAKKRKKKTGEKTTPVMPTHPVGAEHPSHVTYAHEAACSVEFTRDAKRVARWAIKAYGDLEDLDDVREAVLAQDAALRAHEAQDETD